MLQTAFRPSCMNRSSVFVWHKRLKDGRKSMKDDERCGRSKEVNTPELIGQTVRVTMLSFLRGFSKRFRWKRPALFKSGLWNFHQDNSPVHNSILVTDYLTKMDIKTVSHRLYTSDLAHCDCWLFPKLRGCRYETIEEMKETVTKVIYTLTQEDFSGAFPKFLERYKKCIAAGWDYFEGDESFMCVLSIKVPIRKKSGNLSYAPRIYLIHMYKEDFALNNL